MSFDQSSVVPDSPLSWTFETEQTVGSSSMCGVWGAAVCFHLMCVHWGQSPEHRIESPTTPQKMAEFGATWA